MSSDLPAVPSAAGALDASTVAQPALARPETTSYTLRVLQGPDTGATLTVEARLPSPSLIGQSPACELRLADRTASRRHLSAEVVHGALRVVDLGSTNGTRINGLRVDAATLEGGERIAVGESVLLVERGRSAPPELSTATRFGRTIGASVAMRRLWPLCERLAASDVPVVIEGETGTGKEVLAESLHETGPRSAGPFVVFDCTAVPPNLIESALFGHERGAFTGATESRRGVFEEAHGGTLLLDEIGDIDLELQAKLLRALERSEVQRVGSNRWQRVDVRILAATRRDLDQAIQQERFRDDLYYRLAVTRVELPPLRKRAGDISLLARVFWERLCDEPVPEALLARFEISAWPGNVRELHNTVARHVALGDLADTHAPRPSRGATDPVQQILDQRLPLPLARRKMVEHFEQRYLERVLEEHGGNVTRAAAASGVARRYFQVVRARQRGNG